MVFVGYSYTLGFVVATTMAGLGRLVGVSRDTVRRRLEGVDGWGNVEGKGGLWVIGSSGLSKLDRGGNPGNVVGGGFMKGKGEN